MKQTTAGHQKGSFESSGLTNTAGQAVALSVNSAAGVHGAEDDDSECVGPPLVWPFASA